MPKVYVKKNPYYTKDHAPRYFQATMRNVTYRLRSLGTSGLVDILKKALEENEEFLLDLIRYDQLYKYGQNGSGWLIFDYAPYALKTIENKLIVGEPTDRVTLYNTGKFYKRMRFVITDKGFYVSSPTAYTPDLLDKYGEDILRFTDLHFNNVVVPLLRVYAFEAIFATILGGDADRAAAFANRVKRRITSDRNLVIKAEGYVERLKERIRKTSGLHRIRANWRAQGFIK